MVKSGYDELSLILMDSGNQITLSTLKGSKCSLISKVDEKIFIGVDDKLLVTERCLNGECDWKEVLRANHVSNVFRCLTPTKESLYCIEYGEPPTYLYRSKDGYNWESLSKAQDIDKKARHYHSLAYDRYRDMLIVTLGDCCRTKAAVSYDGRNFKAINRGMWQFLPIQVTKQKIIFGLDDPLISGIAIYDPEIGKWNYIYIINISNMYIIHRDQLSKKLLFLKSYSALHSDLRFIDDSIWIAAFAIPQVVLVSVDLIKWYPLIEKSYFPNFNWATISEGKAGLSVTLGDATFIVTKKEVTEVFSKKEPIAYKCKSFELIREKFVAFTYWILNWR